MYFNIKLCRCQLQLHQNIDKKLVYQILKSPAIQMITGLNFNIQMIYSSKKGRVLIDLYYNVMNFKNSKIA
ncbi:FanG protein [Streptococcus dysgalactiae subsp. equisimilis]|uniref:FanG protein n=1 Tax=Streptococcus dysgalactiae TaxID=1334 RepID=UPI001293022E|nr:FanG protein [Streptococcus dysgalactiae]